MKLRFLKIPSENSSPYLFQYIWSQDNSFNSTLFLGLKPNQTLLYILKQDELDTSNLSLVLQ